MFASLGRFAHRRRWWVIGIWLVLFAAAVPVLPRADEPLKVGGFSSPDTEAAGARALLEAELGFAPSSMVVIYRSDRLHATDPAYERQIEPSLAGVRALPGITTVLLPSDDPHPISADGDTAYVVVGLEEPAEEAQRDVPAIQAALRPQSDLDVILAGGPAFYADIETVSQRDLRRAGLISFPFALLALRWVPAPLGRLLPRRVLVEESGC